MLMLGLPFWIATAIKIIAIVFGLVNAGALLLWVERRQSALMQDRMGPNRASVTILGREFRVAGLLHGVADGMKMLWKEDFMPPNADKALYRIAPIISLVPPLCLFVVIPFGPTIFWANRGSVYGDVGGNVFGSRAENAVRAWDIGASAIPTGAPMEIPSHGTVGHMNTRTATKIPAKRSSARIRLNIIPPRK